MKVGQEAWSLSRGTVSHPGYHATSETGDIGLYYSSSLCGFQCWDPLIRMSLTRPPLVIIQSRMTNVPQCRPLGLVATKEDELYYPVLQQFPSYSSLPLKSTTYT
jgi:hypothetical protein